MRTSLVAFLVGDVGGDPYTPADVRQILDPVADRTWLRGLCPCAEICALAATPACRKKSDMRCLTLRKMSTEEISSALERALRGV